MGTANPSRWSWKKIVSVGLTVLSVGIWQVFTLYMESRKNVYIGQYVPPMAVIVFLNLVGLVFSATLPNHWFKYLLLVVQVVAVLWLSAAIVQIVLTAGGWAAMMHHWTLE